MLSRTCLTACVLVAVSVVLQHAQAPASRPQFRLGIEYVEVDARVVDERGEPIRNLTRDDFQVTEDGVAQTIANFVAVDLPVPPQAPPTPFPRSSGVRPDVATNIRPPARGRTYLIVFDALLVAPCWTNLVRKTLRDFIERSVGPDDLVAINSTGRDRSFVNFTNDKARLLAVVGSLMGQGGPLPSVAAAQDISLRAERVNPTGRGAGAPDPPIGDVTMDDARQAYRRLLQIAQAMQSWGEGSRAIILVTESLPFDMSVNPAQPLASQGISMISDIERLATAARRGNVPIYPISPRGLTDGFDCELDGGGSASDLPLAEARRQQDNMRALADDSGGVPIVGSNDLTGGLERVVRLSSYYYVLGFNSSNKGGENRYHRINVTVKRPGTRVISRKGYVTPRGPDRAALEKLAGPPGSSAALRQALNAVLPMTDLPMSITAASFRQTNGAGVSTAVVLEMLGQDLAWTLAGALASPIEMTAAAVEPRGAIRTGEQARVQVTQPAETSGRIRTLGVRWLARLDDLKPGRYQIRGAVSNGPTKQGSAWYDLEIPDYSKAPLAMSDVVIASVVASQRVTLRPDKALAEVLPAPPTTLREFLPIDTIAVYAEAYDNDRQLARDVETSVAIVSDRGEEQTRVVNTLRPAGGVARIQARIPLQSLKPGRYTLAVEARQIANRAISAGRAVPFQIVDAGNK